MPPPGGIHDLDSNTAAIENGDPELTFTPPKGAYTTTLLSELAALDKA